jgi:hypothetical protein
VSRDLIVQDAVDNRGHDGEEKDLERLHTWKDGRLGVVSRTLECPVTSYLEMEFGARDPDFGIAS